MKKNLVTNLVTPPAAWWDVAINGMRNAFKSWDKGDSKVVIGVDSYEDGPDFILGKNDRTLLLGLTAAGDPSHRKVLRQLPVIMDITAPLLFWKQLDTYKVGTTANSESTMHTITKYPFTLDDFDVDFLKDLDSMYEEVDGWLIDDPDITVDPDDPNDDAFTGTEFFDVYVLDLLNTFRDKYLKTNDKKYWYILNELLPQSYIQTRTWSANYEVLLTIIKNRLGHKIPIWDRLITYWLKEVYMLLDLAVAAGIVEIKDGVVCYQDEKDPDVYHTLYEVL